MNVDFVNLGDYILCLSTIESISSHNTLHHKSKLAVVDRRITGNPPGGLVTAESENGVWKLSTEHPIQTGKHG